ncbi:MAG: TlpA family protein disulfide reductase [[Clostridium] fimetarium]|nr:TlpA family protein disulfide reductase [Alistipes timonensis]MCM1406214.1 TlpA family protein disulfide reductase [[Clostridium] fimetarium]
MCYSNSVRPAPVWALLWLFLAALLAGCVNDDSASEPALGVGDSCPRFELVLSDGTRVSSGDFAGRRVMLVFFNTGCEDCRRELPEIQCVADRLEADGSASVGGVPEVICVSRGEGAESVAAYWESNGLTLPYSASGDDRVYRLFASSLIPRVYIIGADSRIEASFAERLPSEAELYSLMRPGVGADGAGQ